MGLIPYEKHVAWRGTYSFHGGVTPYETRLVYFVLKQFGGTKGSWFPTDPLVFCWFYKGLTYYENNVAWRGTYSFHRGLTPYDRVRFALFYSNLGRLGALGVLRIL